LTLRCTHTPRYGAAGERDGVCAGCSAGAIAERVGAGTKADVGAGAGAKTGAVVETAPVLSDTYLSATGLPEKNSPVEKQDSMEDAGGKMLDWNEMGGSGA
jgi:hypothetical protein